MDCVWRGVDDCRFLEAIGVHTLAGHGAACGYHWQSFSLRLTRAAAGLPHPELHCAGRAADGHLIRLPSRLVQIVSAQEWRCHGAGDSMMKIAAALLATVFLAGP